MPRIFGHNLLFVLLAGIVMYLAGFLWYGLLFSDLYMTLSGLTEDSATPAWRMWGVGIAIPFMVAFGMAAVFAKTGTTGLFGYIKLAMVFAVMFAISTALYAFAYEPDYVFTLLWIDAGHLLVSYALGSAVLSFGRSRTH